MTDEVIAQAAEGRLRGTRDGQALRFLGVPYAQAPATAGRFAAPVPPGRWDGIRDALAYGATSPQPDRGITMIPEPVIAGDNELNLNVFTPDLGSAGLPVLVWIHGGGFFGGCNASPWYRGPEPGRPGGTLRRDDPGGSGSRFGRERDGRAARLRSRHRPAQWWYPAALGALDRR
jgi:para-nitrobenzyl esterase